MNRTKNILSLYALNAIVLMFLILYLLFGCKKIELERIVMVATSSVTNVSYASCSVQGTIIDKGEKGIDQHGFCWAVAQNPTIVNNKTQFGSKSSTGNFSGNLTGLSANTTYYVRAYAQNKDGVFYGGQKSFSTLAYSLPTVTTTSINNITENSAQSGGNITDNGGALVAARGVCWSTSSNPTTADSKTIDGSGTGSFTSSLTGLSSETTYYVRAYATNSVGTVYGDEVNFTTVQTIVSPTVTTSSASDIAETSATVGGNVTDDGGATVTERGVYYSTTASPETTGTKLQIGSGTGTFSSSITGLSPGTTYYVIAYATNSVGTAYGNEIEFITIWDNSTISDFDGNVYQTVQICNQIWMKENLKTTKYNDGTAIPLVTNSTEWGNLTTPGYCWYNNDEASYKNTYGALYNGHIVNTGKLCPTGWHVPTNAEWTTLTDYLGGESVAGEKLKEAGTTHWISPNTGATNESGFTALPGGYRYLNGTFYYIGYHGYWWSSTEDSSIYAWYLGMNYDNSHGYGLSTNKEYGFSVRCVRDY